MFRTTAPGATPTNLYTEGTPGLTEATTVGADEMNAIQEEIANTVEGGGLALDPLDSSQLLKAIQFLQSNGSTGRNFLYNSDFSIDQRQEGGSRALVANTVQFVADRWQGIAGTTGGTATVTPLHSLQGEPVAGDGRLIKGYLLWQQLTAPSTGVPVLFQRIPMETSAQTPSGWESRDFTLSCWISGSTSGILTGAVLRVALHDGTNVQTVDSDPFDIPMNPGGVDFNLYEFSGNMPDGSTIVLTPQWVEVQLHVPTNIVGTSIGVSAFQFELGLARTIWERLTWEQELARCQKFFEKSYLTYTPHGPLNADAPGSNASFGATMRTCAVATLVRGLEFRFAVAKYTTPTMTYYALVGTVNRIDWPTVTPRTVTAHTNATKVSAGYPTVSVAGSGVAECQWTAEAEIDGTSAPG